MEGHFAPPPYQQRPTGHLPGRSAGQTSLARRDPDFTPPERITIETSQQTICPGCQKQIRTQVRRKRGKLERNRLTDAVFKTMAILVVPFDEEFIHSCPNCEQRFKIYSMRPHQRKISPQEGLSYAAPPPYRKREHPVPAARQFTRNDKSSGDLATEDYGNGSMHDAPETGNFAQDHVAKTDGSYLITKMV